MVAQQQRQVWLNVAEKPSVAKTLAATLSRGQCRSERTASPYNPLFRFAYEGVDMLVTSVTGHLMEYKFADETRDWVHYPVHELFRAPLRKTLRESCAALGDNVRRYAREADTLVLWLDCDREGENICFEVVELACQANRRLRVLRAHFSTLTERELVHAVQHLRPPDQRLSEAVDARQEMDLRVGAAFTRYQTVRFRSAFAGLSEVLSFGPCQFPTLGFVVRRYWQQRGFVAEDYYTLRLQHEGCVFSSTRGAMYDAVAATLLFDDMCASASAASAATTQGGTSTAAHCSSGGGGVARVVRVHKQPRTRRPPEPLATVALQKLAATHLAMSSEQCMSLAEALYQEGYISYPRTETDAFSFDDATLLELVRVQLDNPDVADYARALLASTQGTATSVSNNSSSSSAGATTAAAAEEQPRFRRPLRGCHDDKAHPPIHPTKAWAAAAAATAGSNSNNNNSGTRDAAKARLYRLIVRHFLACVSSDAVAATTRVEVVYGDEPFSARGTAVLWRGWLAIFPYASWRDSATMPNYNDGDVFTPSSVTMHKSTTTPPPHLTETNLIALMDENGIGTDATIAQHIKTIQERHYVERTGGGGSGGGGMCFVPTRLGIALASAYEMVGLGSLLQPELRAQMELAMGDVVSGRATRAQVVEAAVRQYAAIFDMLVSHTQSFYAQLAQHLQQSESDNSEGGGGAAVLPSTTTAAANNNNSVHEVMRRAALTVDATVLHAAYTPCPTCGPQHAMDMVDVVDTIVPNNSSSNSTHTATTTAAAAASVVRHRRYVRCLHCRTAQAVDALPITRCTVCGVGDLCLRSTNTTATATTATATTNNNSNNTTFFLSCRQYPACRARVSLPRAATVLPCPSQHCAHCGGVLLLFDFAGVYGVPGVDRDDALCVLCDARMTEYIAFKTGVVGNNSNNSSNSNSTSALTSGRADAVAATAAYTLPSVMDADVAGRGRVGHSSSNSRRVSTRAGDVGSGTHTSDAAAAAAAQPPPCACARPARRLISHKPASHGRAFYTCATKQCSFFQWAD